MNSVVTVDTGNSKGRGSLESLYNVRILYRNSGPFCFRMKTLTVMLADSRS
jgi:hypothetical protein